MNKDNKSSSAYSNNDNKETPNLFLINKWVWRVLAPKEDITTQHLAIYWALIEQINSHYWRPTPIALSVLINLTKTTKNTIYAARKILVSYGAIEYTPGRSATQMPLYSIGPAARNWSGTLNEPVEMNNHIPVDISTTTIPYKHPYRVAKWEQFKTQEDKEDKSLRQVRESLFNDFMHVYDHRINEPACKAEFLKLTEHEINEIKVHAPKYVAATPEKRFRKAPINYLKEREWENEIIDRSPVASNVKAPPVKQYRVYDPNDPKNQW